MFKTKKTKATIKRANLHHCVSTVDVSLSDTAGNARRLSQAWYDRIDAWLTDSDRGRLKLIAELLCIITSV